MSAAPEIAVLPDPPDPPILELPPKPGRYPGKPILCHPQMVDSIMAGKKTTTIRVDGLRKLNCIARARNRVDRFSFHRNTGLWRFYAHTTNPIFSCKCLYNEGQTLWVREAWRVSSSLDRVMSSMVRKGTPVNFGERPDDDWGRWRKSMYMPHWVCRTRLLVLSVEPKRVHEFKEADFEADGFELDNDAGCVRIEGEFPPWNYLRNHRDPTREDCLRAEFASMWDFLNSDEPGCEWKSNPWAFVVRFKKL